MTPDPVRAKRVADYYAVVSTDDTPPSPHEMTNLSLAYLDLEARLAAAEGLIERWQTISCLNAEYYDLGYEAALEVCADELSAILKGEGK